MGGLRLQVKPRDRYEIGIKPVVGSASRYDRSKGKRAGQRASTATPQPLSETILIVSGVGLDEDHPADDNYPEDRYTELAEQHRVWPYSDDPANWELLLAEDEAYLAWEAERHRRAAQREADAERQTRERWRSDGKRLKTLVAEQAAALNLTRSEIDDLWESRLRDFIRAPAWGLCLWCCRAESAYRNGLCRACAAYRRKYGRFRSEAIIERNVDRAVERGMNHSPGL